MRSLKSLIEEHEAVWIYCANESLQEQFLTQTEAEGFLARDGRKPTELARERLYGINKNMTMGYLSNLAWYSAFQGGKDKPVRIEYDRFIAGDEDYLCHTSHIKSVTFRNWEVNHDTGHE